MSVRYEAVSIQESSVANTLLARAYTMIPFMWSAGSIFGAAMGGYLARPADTWPRLFPKGSIFTRFPYLLPNVVAAAFIVFAIMLGMAFLKETNAHARSPLFAQLNLPDERTRLIDPSPEASNVNVPEQSKPKRHRASLASMPPLTLGTTIDIRRLSVSAAAESIKPNMMEGDNEIAIEDEGDEGEPPPAHRYSRAMVLLIIQLFLMSYHQMGFSALTPIFLLDGPSSEDMTAEHKLDLQGGLAYTIRDVGMFMAVNGFVALVIQLAIVPPFIAKVGVWKSFVWLTVLGPIVYVFVPFLTALPRPALPIGIYAVLISQAFTLLIIYPCLLIGLKNATPSMSMLGQVNGLAMAGCSGARTISPPAAGAFYSKAGSAAGWWSVGAVAVMAGVLLLFMQPPPKGEGDEAA
jgi:MFS family permease